MRERRQGHPGESRHLRGWASCAGKEGSEKGAEKQEIPSEALPGEEILQGELVDGQSFSETMPRQATGGSAHRHHDRMQNTCAEDQVTVKEFLPTAMSVALWARHWAGKAIWCHYDNAAVVAVINGGPPEAQTWSRMPQKVCCSDCLLKVHWSTKLTKATALLVRPSVCGRNFVI